MGEIEPAGPVGELSMPVSGLELASWIEARLGRKPLWCGDTGAKAARVAGVPAVARALLTAPLALASMRLLPVKSRSKLSTPRASSPCIFMLPGIMPPNAAVFAR